MRLSTHRWLRGLLAAVMALSLAAPAQTIMETPPQAAPVQKLPLADGVAHPLRISAGDLLDVGVFDTPELSGRLRVNEAGEVEIPVAGMVKVAGLTADEAAVAIESTLRAKDIMKAPHVEVFVAEYATQGVTVTGEVKNPGIYPLLGSHGLVDVLTAAGGPTAAAGRVVSITHKDDPTHPETVKLDGRPGKLVANVDIQPGDTIVVSKAGIAYVEGDVTRPGGFLIEGNDRLTVLQIMALAQGTTKTSAKDKARLIRKTPNGREEIPIPLNAMMDGKVLDMPVEDGDILFVPSSKGKIFAYRGIDSAVGMATGLVIGGRL